MTIYIKRMYYDFALCVCELNKTNYDNECLTEHHFNLPFYKDLKTQKPKLKNNENKKTQQ